jgi:hypothetical protein
LLAVMLIVGRDISLLYSRFLGIDAASTSSRPEFRLRQGSWALYSFASCDELLSINGLQSAFLALQPIAGFCVQ